MAGGNFCSITTQNQMAKLKLNPMSAIQLTNVFFYPSSTEPVFAPTFVRGGKKGKPAREKVLPQGKVRHKKKSTIKLVTDQDSSRPWRAPEDALSEIRFLCVSSLKTKRKKFLFLGKKTHGHNNTTHEGPSGRGVMCVCGVAAST